jgi:hypothetical protein
MLQRELIAWAAGFLDGEGSFQALPRGHSYRLTISAVQTRTAEPLNRLQGLFGGSICFVDQSDRPTHADFWKWALDGAPAVEPALRRLIPYLSNKRVEAELLLRLAMTAPARGERQTDSEREFRDRLAEGLKEVRRGEPCLL